MSDSLAYLEVDESVAIVTMNRPEKLNAINRELKAALISALKKADEDPATSVVLLRAKGRSFCVGYDIGGSAAEEEGSRHDAIKWHEILREAITFELTPWDMKKPVVAEVQGHALGGGCELAMMCDITVAAVDALFGEPEIRFSNAGPAIVMPWFIGLKKARELLYLGDMIDAKAALDLGMINKIVPAADLPVAEVTGLAREARAHGLRHQGITRALDKTHGDVRKVRTFSRHAKVETVLIYDDARKDEGGDITRMFDDDD